MEHPHEVPAAFLVDDFADDILWVTGLRPFHATFDRGLNIRCQQYLEVLGFGRCCGSLEVCQFTGVHVRHHLRHDHVVAIGEMGPRHRCRQKPPGLERVAEAVAAAADHGSYPVDIEVEDTGMPVSERARDRRFPDAGRPVQVDESYHLRDATFGIPPVLLIGAEALPGKISVKGLPREAGTRRQARP
jgi:hypothetical protein